MGAVSASRETSQWDNRKCSPSIGGKNTVQQTRSGLEVRRPLNLHQESRRGTGLPLTVTDSDRLGEKGDSTPVCFWSFPTNHFIGEVDKRAGPSFPGYIFLCRN